MRQTAEVAARLQDLGFALLRRLDPERAHGLALAALRAGLGGAPAQTDDSRLAVRALGVTLRNPICLAAGFDKDALALAGLARLGFGAIEAGTVTLRPQPGNPRPRLFRLPDEAAIINRMGFNSGGIERFARRLAATPRAVPVGVNIGLNRNAAEPMRDYPRLAAAVAGRADWITVNVSSPNTPGLRDLQAPDRLAAILAAIRAARPDLPPLLVKLAPDLTIQDLPPIIEACVAADAAGLVVANTTLSRPPGLRGRYAGEAGGLSGRPLFRLATERLLSVARLARGRLVLVGAGGIESGEDVVAKLRAGATFVQLYTAFALRGPGLLGRLKADTLAALARHRFPSVGDAVGADL